MLISPQTLHRHSSLIVRLLYCVGQCMYFNGIGPRDRTYGLQEVYHGDSGILSPAQACHSDRGIRYSNIIARPNKIFAPDYPNSHISPSKERYVSKCNLTDGRSSIVEHSEKGAVTGGTKGKIPWGSDTSRDATRSLSKLSPFADQMVSFAIALSKHSLSNWVKGCHEYKAYTLANTQSPLSVYQVKPLTQACGTEGGSRAMAVNIVLDGHIPCALCDGDKCRLAELVVLLEG